MKFKKIKSKKNIKERNSLMLFLLFCVFTLSLTVGYSALNKEFNISGEANFRVQEDIRITNVELAETTNLGLENYANKYSKNTISLGVDLKNLSSTITYKVTIVNSGTVAMWIDSIIQEVNNNTNMEYVLDGIGIRELINPGEVKEFNLTIKYKNGISLPSNTNLDTRIKFNFIKPTSVLSVSSGAASEPFFNGTITKESVESITFSPSLEVGTDAMGFWDASYYKDGTVIAWYTDKDNDKLYEVTIGGAGIVHTRGGYGLFGNFVNVTSINFEKYIDTSEMVDMGGLFQGDTSLTSLDLSTFDTKNATIMYWMFSGCKSLTNINLSSFDTSKVTSFGGMFLGCRSLTKLDLRNFDTSKVKGMNSMFVDMVSLETLDLSSFNTSNVTTMNEMFMNCPLLTNLNISNFDTSNVTSMANMFNRCSSLTNLNISNFNTSNVTEMNGMFSGCTKFTTLDLSRFNTIKVINMAHMFENCKALTTLDISHFGEAGFSTTGETLSKDTSYMFSYCSALKSIKAFFIHTNNAKAMFYGCSNLTDVSFRFKSDTPSDMTSMFSNCSKLNNVDGVFGSVIGNELYVGDLSYMFDGDVLLTGVDLSKFSSSEKKLNTSYMFNNCKALTTIKGSFIAGYDASYMFNNCTSLKSLTVPGAILTNATHMFSNCTNLDYVEFGIWTDNDNYTPIDMSYMFYNCPKLETVVDTLMDIYTKSASNMSYMFYGCENLVALDYFVSIDTSKATDMSYMFYDCLAIERNQLVESYYFDTSSVTNMSHMFYRCESLNYLDTHGFHTGKVTDMSYMFAGCTKLDGDYTWNGSTIDYRLNISNFDTSNVTDMSYMFAGCSLIRSVDLSKFNTSNVTNMSHMFYNCENLYLEMCGQLFELVDFSLRFDSFNTDKVTDMTSMFEGCSSLEGLGLVGDWNFEPAAKAGGTSNMFKDMPYFGFIFVPSSQEKIMQDILNESESAAMIYPLDV